MAHRALVLFSGGQDSTVCLAWALRKFDEIETIGFAYGQRHIVELACRTKILAALRTQFPNWCAKLGQDHTVDAGVIGSLSESSLTRQVAIEVPPSGPPNSFVPGRNLLFLTFAAAVAYRRDCRHLVGGMCETDYSGYPDCRDDTMKAMQIALNLGMERRFVIHTPLMWRDKADTWEMAEHLGGAALIELVRTETHSCYEGDRGTLHNWGYGCGVCPACVLRRQGYDRYLSRGHDKG